VRLYPIRQLILCEEDFGWTALSDFNPEILEPLCLMVSADTGEIKLAKGIYDWEMRSSPLLYFNLVFPLNGGKSMAILC
jgi:hypothetical protein